MREHRATGTANRSVVGTMNESTFLATTHRADDGRDLLGLSLRLATTPRGPLNRTNISPDRELAATLRSNTT